MVLWSGQKHLSKSVDHTEVRTDREFFLLFVHLVAVHGFGCYCYSFGFVLFCVIMILWIKYTALNEINTETVFFFSSTCAAVHQSPWIVHMKNSSKYVWFVTIFVSLSISIDKIHPVKLNKYNRIESEWLDFCMLCSVNVNYSSLKNLNTFICVESLWYFFFQIFFLSFVFA